MKMKDRINNCKLILRDFELNSIAGRTREPFTSLDDQCEYLEETLKYLAIQIDNFDIRRDI